MVGTKMTILFLPADRWTADSIWLLVHGGAFQPEHDACSMHKKNQLALIFFLGVAQATKLH